MLKSTRDAIFCTKTRDQKGRPVSAILIEARLNGQSCPSYVILTNVLESFANVDDLRSSKTQSIITSLEIMHLTL